MSRRGLVSPEERRVQATDKVSTLAQFRAIDYGMERCEIHVRFPINTTTAASSGRPFILSVNRLKSRIPIDTKKLSYASKPGLVSTISQIRVDPTRANEEVHWWQRFDCPWDELFTFELACFDVERLGDGGDDCRVEWWQNREGKDPRSGMNNFPFNTCLLHVIDRVLTIQLYTFGSAQRSETLQRTLLCIHRSVIEQIPMRFSGRNHGRWGKEIPSLARCINVMCSETSRFLVGCT
ncbi:hypothetical protein EDD18DRAFT_1078458 [Armillaria luteobubalina]|uniref:Uncharacterized protein n=1 Tax=Armillaria luteobubalina TaxID=153913 RepID=A0AA39Q114_9AGAR|nr:hypothetical protein EDD18DRAFT_1078458 [Armillaria luteobubalina]